MGIRIYDSPFTICAPARTTNCKSSVVNCKFEGGPVMANASCEIRIGTSGWHYKHWLGRFYPEKLPKDKWLAHYAQHFDTVEINNTFYHLPREQTMLNWHDRVPANFLFAVKANRYITHVKKLKDPAETLHRFFDLANLLEEHLGPVLYQL